MTRIYYVINTKNSIETRIGYLLVAMVKPSSEEVSTEYEAFFIHTPSRPLCYNGSELGTKIPLELQISVPPENELVRLLNQTLPSLFSGIRLASPVQGVGWESMSDFFVTHYTLLRSLVRHNSVSCNYFAPATAPDKPGHCMRPGFVPPECPGHPVQCQYLLTRFQIENIVSSTSITRLRKHLEEILLAVAPREIVSPYEHFTIITET